MSIPVECSECGQSYEFAEEKAGRSFRCKECSAVVAIPEAVTADGPPEVAFHSSGADLPDFSASAAVAPKPQLSTALSSGVIAPRHLISQPSAAEAAAAQASKLPPRRKLPLGLHHFVDPWLNTLNYRDRSSWGEYWYFVTLSTTILLVMSTGVLTGAALESFPVMTVFLLIGLLFAIAVIFPLMALTVRRLHDTDRPGLWIPVCFILLGFGPLILLLFMLFPGDEGENTYGPNPRLRPSV